MSKNRRERLPSDKTQHGDPPVEADRESPNALTVDELVGKPDPVSTVKAETTGPIAMPKRCADCFSPLPVDAATCPKCAPTARATPLGGTNTIDPTARPQTPAQRQGEPPWWAGPIATRR